MTVIGNLCILCLIVGGPNHNRWIVLVMFNHVCIPVQNRCNPFFVFPEFLGTGWNSCSSKGSTMALNICVHADIQAEFICQIIHDRIIWIVCCTNCIQIMLLHGCQIGEIFLISNCMSLFYVCIMTVYTTQNHLLAIDLQLLQELPICVFLFCANLAQIAEPNPFHNGFHCFSIFI